MRVQTFRTIFKTIAILLLAIAGLSLIGGGLFAVKVFSRKPIRAIHSTTHPSLNRKSCVDCHAPIADEWRQSYHYKSVSGPYWKDVQQMGYVAFFDKIRKPCVNCHAPANVLDLPASMASGGSIDIQLGIECSPNILEEPKGIQPLVRSDDVGMGVDCVSCHVSKHGIMGTGRYQTTAHETLMDPRFRDAGVTSNSFCKTCHGSAVKAWEKTKFANEGVTCLDCHMPLIEAPSVVGGPERLRRSHRFLADKDDDMMRNAVHGTLEITTDRKARLLIMNDRVGHYLPSGANWLLVYLRTYGAGGQLLSEHKEAVGREETLLLDFWPFNIDRRIVSGGQKELSVPLPKGHGRVEAMVRYWDWMHVIKTVLTLKQKY